MGTVAKVLLIVLIVLVLLVIALYFLGKKMQKKQAEQQAQIDAAKQSVSMLIIDKKKMKLKDAGLPAVVLEQAPKYMRRAKLPIVKAKIGPQILSLICDAEIFDSVPVKKEVKATISGIYITDVKGIRGPLAAAPAKKKSKFKTWVAKMQEKAGANPIK
ncbi:MAG: hypothetical protein K2N89_09500 [Lachnospiraceae bacterium]|nr:hypothetical protein [Lachnospiraceae bacterium]